MVKPLNSLLVHGLLESAEQLVNPLIKRDASAVFQLGRLSGRVVRLRCTQPEIAVLIWPSGEGLHIERDTSVDFDANEEPPQIVDAEIEGSLEHFMRFMLASEQREAMLFEGVLTLRGDTGLVRKLQQVIASLDLDIASISEKCIGIVPTAIIGEHLAGLIRWKRSLVYTGALDLQEYLQEEMALLPTKAEQQSVADGILNTRRRIDRLDARVQRLQQQVLSLMVTGTIAGNASIASHTATSSESTSSSESY
jgi:ubiquinone biosynthesis protein UbiJ